MSESTPVISVIMGVYNQKFQQELLDAVNSILDQTFKDFEFIIYNDGSDPELAEHIYALKELDNRIIIIGKEINHGLAFSLNTCIGHARGKYIARMDADDISLPERLQKEYEFLEAHPEYSWVGCNAEIFDKNGTWGYRDYPETPTKEDYLRFSPFIHPTVMFRGELFDGHRGYNTDDETLRCEDYELFMRLERKGFKGYNIQEYLFRYREYDQSFNKRKFKFRINEAKVRFRNFKEMKMLFPKGWMYVLRPIIGGIVPNRLLVFLKRNDTRSKRG